MSRELLRRALDFTEFCWREVAMNDYAEEKRADLEAALREALNAPEPVAEIFDTFGNSQDPNKAVGHVWLKAHYFPPIGTKLYAAPPAAPDHFRDVAEKPADPWREAVLDRLAVLCMDAPLDEPPASILRRIVAAEVEIALDPSVSDVAPAAPVVREPLPTKQIEVVIYDHTKLNPNQADDRELIGCIVNAIRAIEAAHGITGGSNG